MIKKKHGPLWTGKFIRGLAEIQCAFKKILIRYLEDFRRAESKKIIIERFRKSKYAKDFKGFNYSPEFHLTPCDALIESDQEAIAIQAQVKAVFSPRDFKNEKRLCERLQSYVNNFLINRLTRRKETFLAELNYFQKDRPLREAGLEPVIIFEERASCDLGRPAVCALITTRKIQKLPPYKPEEDEPLKKFAKEIKVIV